MRAAEILYKANVAILKRNKKAAEKLIRRARSISLKFSETWVHASLLLAKQLFSRHREEEAKPLLLELREAKDRNKITLTNDQLIDLLSMQASTFISDGEYEAALPAVSEARKLDEQRYPTQFAKEHQTMLVQILQAQSKGEEKIPAQKLLVDELLRRGEINQELVNAVFAVEKMLEQENLGQARLYRQGVFEKLVENEAKRAIKSRLSDVPDDWGRDPITEYVETGRTNEVASIESGKRSREKINLMDARFRVGLALMRWEIAALIQRKYPRQRVIQVKLKDKDWLEVFFLMRCHATFLCAVRLAYSGAIPEAYMVARACLENAVYAFHIAKVPADKGLWLGRKNPQTKKQMKEAFKFRPLVATIAKFSSAIADKALALYDLAIDKGAHPTLDTFTDHTRQGTTSSELYLSLLYLNYELTEPCIDDVLAVAECALEIFKVTFPDLLW